ncbi:cilia- and flagella-associated protein 54-like isoform X4 [Mercenaria mercenaria]|uniref:cilia- and flagella-associated protein 54-like isoform X4 n=1 Tax=Mercenaria mercenaria TaxID=6596 RepID=UPI00234E46C4|nr:cilia- and flagella-associated protein 54-like isoform X4 [Mercenaria mercenaria]
MASILRSAAAAVNNKGMPSSFYSKDKPNPVFQSLDKEIRQFMGFIKKRNTQGYQKPNEEAQSRSADTLFEIWNKYEPRLPKAYYQEKLLEVGDFLMSAKEYSLALWQCYDRYLMHFGDINVVEISDIDTFKSTFFKNGFDGDSAGLTFRALMGKCISMYQVVRSSDPKLQNAQNVVNCVQILTFLRLVTQVILPIEKLCWLVYNGTIHIYSISRYLMSLGHSAKVLEYLIWACMCMETSVPLLTVKYLSWRSTLYTAVCQAYFDCKATEHAESFARRGLSKIQELSQLESMSNAEDSPEREVAFRQATIKMAIMVFRRSVYETRRRPKGLLRPKTRANLKDAQNLQWPRTPSEKLLHDMFEGSSTQLLCILEALNDTNRRILITSPPAPDSEVEILDVYAELFMAAQEILAGGGGVRAAMPKPTSPVGVVGLAGIVPSKSLMEMASKGEDGATVEGAIKIVKYAFCYEQWDVFEVLSDTVLTYLRIIGDDRYVWDEKCLQILSAMEKIMSSKKNRRTALSMAEEDQVDHELAPSVLAQSTRSVNLNDEMILLADILMSVISGPFTPETIEVDVIVDAALFLWNKCKAVFQKYQTGSVDNPKYLSKMENPTKWVYILDVVHQLLCWCGISSVDPALTAEVVLRLGLVLESSAHLDQIEARKLFTNWRRTPSSKKCDDSTSPCSTTGETDGRSPLKDSSMSDLGMVQDGSQHVSRTSMLSSSLLNVNPRNQLLQARDILELGLKNVSFARQAVALADGKSIADISWAKKVIPTNKLPPELEGVHDPFLPSLHELDRGQSPLAFENSMGKGVPASKRELNKELFTPDDRQEGEVTEDTFVDRDELIPESMRGTATAVWNTVKDLHLELILMYHRVCLKLEQMGADPATNMPKPFKRRTCSRMQFGSDRSLIDTYVESMDELLGRANKNNISKALLYMQKAYLSSNDGKATKEQKKLLENAATCIQKAQVEEKRTYLENTGICEDIMAEGRVPPPPILLSRTDNSMVFKPAPWKPSTAEKVAWYRIFARNATGSNVKARLNDYYFQGTGEQIPYHHTELRVSGLKANERYVFGVAAYTVDGKLIGDSIGESTRPILANHPLPVLTTWAFLSQISYQIGCYEISRRACDVLWDHFIAEAPPPEGRTYTSSNERDFKLTLMRLNQKIVCLSSPVNLRLFLTSIFISVDINVREGKLFCDSLTDKGPLYRGQIKRLKECEKMLVAIELAGWLNESNLALQAVVQCYGLVAPLIFYKIPSIPVFQVLQRCHAVLQEIPAGLRQKRPTSIADSLHHMTACITFHMAKVLRNWGQKSLANNLNDAGRKLLAVESGEPAKDQLEKGSTLDTSADNEETAGSINLQALKNKSRRGKRGTVSMTKDHEADGPLNEELKALEAHMLSISKQAQSDHELSGNEDPSILHAYIAYLPSRIAYREVAKFKKRARYLEFFVQVAQKALTEGLPEIALDWCEDTETWIARRNEQIIGIRAFLTKQPGGTMTVTGDDPKKFAAAMVEYSKEKAPSRLGMSQSRTGKSVSRAGVQQTSRASSKLGVNPSQTRRGSTIGIKAGAKLPSGKILMISEEEFSSPRAPQGGAKMVQNKGQSAPKAKRKQKYKALHVNQNMSDAARQAQEEAEVKALEKVSQHLPDMFRGWHRKKRLRKICTDEMPWKCQLNILQGLAQFNAFLHKLEKREKVLGNQDSIMYKTNFLDQEWFVFETAGTLVVGWEGGPLHHANVTEPGDRQNMKDGTKLTTITDRDRDDSELSSDDDLPTISSKAKTKTTEALDLAGYERPKTTATGIEIAAALATGAPPPPMFTEPPIIEDTPRTYRSDLSTSRPHGQKTQEQQQDKTLLTAEETLDFISKSFDYFRKAIVLAHRGQYWTLLQNAARALWNSAHTALLRAYTPTLSDQDNGLLTIDEIRSKAWKPLHVAADCLLDMMTQLQLDLQAQTAKAKSKGKKLGEYFESWTGSVLNEAGGASLKFEDPTDNQSVLDVRFIRRLVLRVLEILYYEEKWEKLVDIALKFNALTNERHAEQVIPLLVQAQRKLTDGIQELGGKLPPQPHYQQLMYRLNSVVTAKTYLTQQLELVIDKSNLPPVPAGAGIDPLGHGLYTSKDALKNVSVPLDVPYSLSVLYDAFDKSQYTSRALQHSRKLMVLYLANQQNMSEAALSRQPSRVDFIPNTARPQPTMPPDISREEYLDPSDVQTAPIHRSQIGTVITSYEKTIEMLLAKNARDLAAQAMHETGNLHYHVGNLRAAYKWWSEALELILNADDVLHTWRDLFKDASDISAELLQRCGIWGCVLAAILTSNVAQFILTSDLGLRTECCFLSGYLFKAIFRSSLPHPLADRDYAMYEVGEGCEVTNLIPGVDLLSEKYRADGRQVLAALRWVIEELARGHHNLFVLPLMTLNQYFATFVCRDLQRTVDGRILKCRVLSDLGLFSEALQVLQRLLHGERLPHTGDSSFRQVESKVIPLKFNTSKPITEPSNLKVLENVLDKRLSSNLGMLYGPHMTCHLSLVQAHLFVCLAQTLPVLPNIEDIILPEGGSAWRQLTISTVSRPGTLGLHGIKAAETPSKPRKVGTRPSKTDDTIVELDEDREIDTITEASEQTADKPDKKEDLYKDEEKGDNKSENAKEDNSVDDLADEEKSDTAGSSNGTTRDGTEQTTLITKRFSGAKKPVNVEFIKGTLLVIADQMAGTIADVIQENAELDGGKLDDLSAAELELVVLCKLEQAAIARQKHHAPMAARIVLSSLKLLQSSHLFRKKKLIPHPPRPSSLKSHGDNSRKKPSFFIKLSEPENSQFQYQNFQSRSRLDARLWLACRSSLVQSLMMEIRGMGDVKGIPKIKEKIGSDNKVLQELADCRQYCAEGLGEAEACGDIEKQSEFLMQGASLNIIEGKNLEHTISLLQDSINTFSRVPCLSIPGAQMKATALVMRTDLEAIEHTDDSIIFTERTMENYLHAQDIILKQMEDLGEKIEHYYPEGRLQYFSTPHSPLRNIYLPHCLRLVQIKLRVGHGMARNVAKNIRNSTVKQPRYNVVLKRSDIEPVPMWSDVLGVLMTALAVSQVSVTREAYLEAELLLNIGKVQRMLVYLGKYQPRHAAQSLIDAIKISHSTDHNLGLIRQAYLEIALIYMYSSGIATMKEGSSIDIYSGAESGSEDTSSETSKKKYYRKRYKPSKKQSKDSMNEQEKERHAAWLAIRSAAAVANTQRNRLLLIGDVSVTSQQLSEKAQQEMPDFVALDLVGGYVLGEKKKVYKNEIEEELAPLVEAQEVKHVDTYEELIQKAKEAANDLSWIQFLGYQTILQRLCSTSTISASSGKQEDRVNQNSSGDLGPEFDLGFISHAESDTSLNHDVVRSMLFSGTWTIRLNRMHSYLSDNLNAYGTNCCAVYPPADLQLPLSSEPATELQLVTRSYETNLTHPSDIEAETQIQIDIEIPAPGMPPLPPGSLKNSTRPADKPIVSATDNEVTLQWYQPSLEETDPARPEASGPESRVLLMYALNMKSASSTSASTKISWVQISQLNDLHDRLAVLMQRAEIYLPSEKGKKKDVVATAPTPTPKTKKNTQRIKALSPKVKKDETLENLLRQCIDDITNILGSTAEPDTSSSITEVFLYKFVISYQILKKKPVWHENQF